MAEANPATVLENKNAAPTTAEVLPKAPTTMLPREQLLVWMKRPEILKAIQDNPTVLLIAGTGTGKTRGGTQIALEAIGSTGNMVMTENLRKATEEGASTVAIDMGEEEPGKTVGFTNRYHKKYSDSTRLLFCPIQSLLNKVERDHDLSKYDLIMVDEVHKESKQNEILLATLKDIQAKRAKSGHPLKIVLTSATMDEVKLKDYFPGAAKIEIPGANFDVDVQYHDKEVPLKELPKAAAEKVKWAIDKGDEGNILVFFSGKPQIDEAQKALAEMKLGDDIEVHPYYGTMTKEAQNEISKKLKETGKRMVFLATNAAQESLTWPIKVVVDTCTHKHNTLDTITGRDTLSEEKAPLDHLTQRKGRVGRKDPGKGQLDKYYPLTTKSDWEGRKKHETAEIQRTDLTREMLTLLASGYDPYPSSTKANAFKYLNKPDRSHVDMAYKRLQKVGAMDKDGNLTDKGQFMASLQLNMNNASLVADGLKYGVLEDSSALAAMLEVYYDAFEGANDSLAKLKGSQKSDLLPFIKLLKDYGGTAEKERAQFVLNLGLRPDKMEDAYDLYTRLLADAGTTPPPFTPAELSKIGGSGLDLAIHDSFADTKITGSNRNRNSLMVEGVGGSATVRIDRNSVLFKDKALQSIVSTNIRTVKENGMDSKIAGLNHEISVEAEGYIYEQEHQSIIKAPPADSKEPGKKVDEQVVAEAEVKPPEDKPEIPPEPVKKLPWYKNWWLKAKNWFSHLFS